MASILRSILSKRSISCAMSARNSARVMWSRAISSRVLLSRIFRRSSSENLDTMIYANTPNKTVRTVFQMIASTHAPQLTSPSATRFVQTAIGILGGFREHLSLPSGPCTERLASCSVFFRLWMWCGRFQSRLARVCAIVGGATFGIKPTFGVLPFFSGPSWRLSHLLPF